MPGRSDSGNRGGRRPGGGRNGGGRPSGPSPRPGPPGGNKAGGPPGPKPALPRRAGGLNLRRLGGNDFELVHPRCVREMELDFEEGMEIWKAGDPEGARDALRFALQGCGDNLWVHVALGQIALDDFRDPSLARGHFGYAFELAQRAFPPHFAGRLPRDRMANRPFYDALDGLAACYEALGNAPEAASLRAMGRRLLSGSPPPPERGPAPGREGDGPGSPG